MLYKYLKKYSDNPQHKDETIFDKALEQFQKDKEKREEELFQFINEFVNSEEYEEYLEQKKRIRKRNVAVQYSLSDLNVQETLIEDKFPLTTKSKRMFAFVKHFESYTKNKENADIIKRQEKGIAMIKKKINQYKKLYEFTRDKIFPKKETEKEKILQEFCESLNIDISTVNLGSRKKIRDTIVCYQKIKHGHKLKTRNNIMDIVKKLTEEYKRKKEIDNTLNKTYLYKVKRKEKIMKNMAVVGKKIILRPRGEVKDPIEIIEDLPLDLTEEPEPKVEKEKKGGKDKSKRSSEKSDKKDGEKEKTKPKKQKETKEKKIKPPKKEKKTKQKDELVLPPIPKCNLRLKMGSENYENLLELLTHFDYLENMMEDQHMLAQKRVDDENLYINTNFVFKPDVIQFKHFRAGKIYKKKLKIINCSFEIQKLRILQILFPDPYDALLFKVLPLIGVRKLATGCSVDLTIIFSPKRDYDEGLQGKLVFVGYNRGTLECEKCFVAIQCIPPYHDLKIEPTHLTNKGRKPLEAIIKKITHPIDVSIEADAKNSNDRSSKAEISFILSFLEDCVDNVLSNFQFEHYYIKLRGMEEKKLNIRLKDVSYIGSYFEKYYLNIYESDKVNDNLYSGCQEISISAETTDYFIKLSSDVVDFGVCILNSIYQTHLDICNESSITQVISLKFPSTIMQYINTDIVNLFIPPHGKRIVWLRFLPRKTLFDMSNYYDKGTSILEFPILICTINKTYPDIPMIKATVFAVLSTQNCLAISHAKKDLTDSSSLVQINLGVCSIYETVSTDMELINNTLAPQIYGFVNIPQCVTIGPNYGFGEIKPNEKKILTLQFSPDLNDIIDKLEIEGGDLENVTNFRINLETVSHLGQCKKKFNAKKFFKVADVMLKELKNPGNIDLIHDMEICAYYIKVNMFTPDTGEEGTLEIDSEKCMYEDYPASLHKKDEQICLTQVWVKVKIVNPLLEFSHQFVEFPDTPCGSYSVLHVELKALDTAYLCKKSKGPINYNATFKINGGNDQIRIEPSCGTLKKGEVKKIFIIVKPNTPEDIINDTARSLKYSEVYEQKKEEYELTKQKRPGTAKKDKKNKNGEEIKAAKKAAKEEKETKKTKNGSKKERKDSKRKMSAKSHESNFVLSEKDVKVDYLDFYPAQMYYWRNMQPYNIKATFTCNIYYDIENMVRKPDTLYLDAVCRVIKPDFIADLKLPRVDFGKVALGMKKCEAVVIQNIHYDFIKPEFSLLSPVGPFSIMYMKDVRIPPEHFLEVPLFFRPQFEGPVEEYFEIRCGKTILPLILHGISVPPQIDISPHFLVCRLQTHKDLVVQCPIEVKNKTETRITIVFEKVFELEGMIKEIVKHTEDKVNEVGNKTDKASKSDKSDKSKAGKKGKENKGDKIGEQKFSDVLSEAEETSFPRFVKKSDGFCYDIINLQRNKIDIEPNAMEIIKIGFGSPKNLLEKKHEELRKLGEKQRAKDKGGKETKGKGKASSSEKSSKKGKEVKGGKLKQLPENQIYHITKYNIMLNKMFLKDFILISTFVG